MILIATLLGQELTQQLAPQDVEMEDLNYYYANYSRYRNLSFPVSDPRFIACAVQDLQ